MKHPEKWRETVDPYSLPYHYFTLTEVIGYPHAGNDVFQAKGIYKKNEVEVYIKAARQTGADLANETAVIRMLHCDLAPQIIDYDDKEASFVVALARKGERLSTIVGDNADRSSLDYLYEYGQTLAKMHKIQGNFQEVKDRRFFHIPEKSFLEELGLLPVYEYLISHQPDEINRCFCHGDFHYANILWENKHISAILDFELAGIGNKEFDIAWALILRPGQKFLNSEEEISLFMKGYSSAGCCRREYVEYYMILIYTWFYKIGSSDPEYQSYITGFFRKHLPFS